MRGECHLSFFYMKKHGQNKCSVLKYIQYSNIQIRISKYLYDADRHRKFEG